MTRTIQEQRERLTKEETQLRRKWDRRQKEADRDQRRVDAIQAELRRLEELPEGVSRGVGVRYANEAVDRLKRIPKNDGLRKRGFQIVTDWIRQNSRKAKCWTWGR
jgi:predicted nuclease with TOPRIM domain